MTDGNDPFKAFGGSILTAEPDKKSGGDPFADFGGTTIKKKVKEKPTSPESLNGSEKIPPTNGSDPSQSPTYSVKVTETRTAPNIGAPVKETVTVGGKEFEVEDQPGMTSSEMAVIGRNLMKIASPVTQKQSQPAPNIPINPEIQVTKIDNISPAAAIGNEQVIDQYISTLGTKEQEKFSQTKLDNEQSLELLRKAYAPRLITLENDMGVFDERGVPKALEALKKIQPVQETNKFYYDQAVLDLQALDDQLARQGGNPNNPDFQTKRQQAVAKIKEQESNFNETAQAIQQIATPEMVDQIDQFQTTINEYYGILGKITTAESKMPDVLEKKKYVESLNDMNVNSQLRGLDLASKAYNSVTDAVGKIISSVPRVAGGMTTEYKMSDKVADSISEFFAPKLTTTQTLVAGEVSKKYKEFYDANADKINWSSLPDEVANQVGSFAVLAGTGVIGGIAGVGDAVSIVMPGMMLSYEDAYTRGKEIYGEDVQSASTYALASSFITGLTEMIMPDRDIISGGVINKLSKNFVTDYAKKGRTYAYREMTKTLFVNTGKEIAEEMVDRWKDVVLNGMVNLSGGNVEYDAPTINEQLSIAASTAVLTGIAGTGGAIRKGKRIEQMALADAAKNYGQTMKILDGLEKGGMNVSRVKQEVSETAVRLKQVPVDLSTPKRMAIQEKLGDIEQLEKINASIESPFIRQANDSKIKDIQKDIVTIMDDQKFDEQFAKEVNEEIITPKPQPNESVQKSEATTDGDVAITSTTNITPKYEIDPSPVSKGVFGNIYDQFKGRIKEGIDFLMRKREGEVVGVINRPDIGYIDIPYGKGGETGYGLAHILERRTSEGINPDEIFDAIPDIIENGKIIKQEKNRVYLEKDDKGGIIRLDYDGKSKNWLLTAYFLDKKNLPLEERSIETPLDDKISDVATTSTLVEPQERQVKDTTIESKIKPQQETPQEIGQAATQEEGEVVKLVQEQGEQVQSLEDAEIALGQGDRIFAFDEMENKPIEITDVTQLKGYASDQIVTVSRFAENEPPVSPIKRIIQPIIDRIEKTFGTKVKMAKNADEVRKMAEVGGKFSIVGEKANLPKDKAVSLDKAKTMESDGKSSNDIWEQTGWERGKGGGWNTDFESPKISELFKSEMAPIILPYFSKITGTSLVAKLGDVVDINELSKIYPDLDLGNMEVIFIDNKDVNYRGGITEKNGKVTSLIINTHEFRQQLQGNSFSGLQRTITHELQHVLQNREGMPVGTSIGQARQDRANALREAYIHIFISDNPIIKRIKAIGDFTVSYITPPNKWYEQNTGEVQSRNAAKRDTLTPAEKAKTPISETEDVSRSKQINKYMLSPTGEILGATLPDGTIVLNEETLNPNTPMHEAGHLWQAWVKQNNPQLYQAGLDKVKNSPYLTKAKASEFYQGEANKLPKDQREEFFADEALAMAIGDNGALLVNQAKQSDFNAWLDKLWQDIAKFFGIEQLTPKQIDTLSLEEFSKMVAARVLEGKPLKTQAPVRIEDLTSETIDLPNRKIQAFHATHTGDVKSGKEAGIHLGTQKAADNKGHVETVTADIKNPLVLEDMEVWDSNNLLTQLFNQAGKYFGINESAIREIRDSNITEKEKQQKVIDILKSKGFDAVVYKNTSEDKGNYSIVVFDESQLTQEAENLPNQAAETEPVSEVEAKKNITNKQQKNESTKEITDNNDSRQKAAPSPNKGIGKGRVSKSKRKIREPNYLKALELETNNPIDQALQYFISGGKITTNVLNQLFGDKSTNSLNKIKGEVNRRIGLLNQKTGAKTIDAVSEYLWENQDNEGQHDSMAFREAVETVLMGHNSTKTMVDELLSRNMQSIQAQEEYWVSQLPDDALQLYDEMVMIDAWFSSLTENEQDAIADRVGDNAYTEQQLDEIEQSTPTETPEPKAETQTTIGQTEADRIVTFNHAGQKVTGLVIKQDGDKIIAIDKDGIKYPISESSVLSSKNDEKLATEIRESDKVKNKLKEAAAKVKRTWKDLFDSNLGIMYDPQREAQKMYDFHVALVQLAQIAIQSGVKSVSGFAKQIGRKIDDFMARAWEDAKLIESGEQPIVANVGVMKALLKKWNHIEENNAERARIRRQNIRSRLLMYAVDSKETLFRKLNSLNHYLADAVSNYVTVIGGSASDAQYQAEIYMSSIFGGLSTKREYAVNGDTYSAKELFNRVLIFRRVIAIEQKIKDTFNNLLAIESKISTENALANPDPVKLSELKENRDVAKDYLETNDVLTKDPTTKEWKLGQRVFTKGLTESLAKGHLQQIEMAYPELYEDLTDRAEAYHEAFNILLLQQKEAGLISQQSYDELIKYDYVPMKNVAYLIEGIMVDTGGLKLLSKDASLIKKLKQGSEEDLSMAFDDMLKFQTFGTKRKIAENKAAIKLAELVVDEPDNGIFYEPPVIGVDKYGNPEYGSIPKTDGLIYYYQDGIKKAIAADNRIVLQWYGANEITATEADNFLSNILLVNLLRNVTTNVNPTFGIAQLAIDMPQAILTNDAYSSVLTGITQLAYKNARLLATKAVGGSEFNILYNEARKAGALTTFSGREMDYFTLKKAGKENAFNKIVNSNAVRSTGKWITNFNSTFENVTRLSVYEKKRNTLISEYVTHTGTPPIGQDLEDIRVEAAATARNILNYSRGGIYAKKYNRTFAYLNVGFQVPYSIMKYAWEHPIEAGLKAIELTTYGALFTVLGYLGSDDDDKDKYIEYYNKMYPYERRLYFHIKIPGATMDDPNSSFFRIPKPKILLPLINSVEAYSMKLATGGKTKMNDLDQDIIDAFPFPLGTFLTGIPALNAFFNYFLNYDIYRRKQVVKDEPQIPDYLEGINDPTVGTFYKYLGKQSKDLSGYTEVISPKRLQSAVNSGIGNLERNVLTNIPITVGAMAMAAMSEDYNEIKKQIPDSGEKSIAEKIIETTGLPQRFKTIIPETDPDLYEFIDKQKRREFEKRESMRADVDQILANNASQSQAYKDKDALYKQYQAEGLYTDKKEFNADAQTAENYIKKRDFLKTVPGWYKSIAFNSDNQIKELIFQFSTQDMSKSEKASHINVLYREKLLSKELGDEMLKKLE